MAYNNLERNECLEGDTGPEHLLTLDRSCLVSYKLVGKLNQKFWQIARGGMYADVRLWGFPHGAHCSQGTAATIKFSQAQEIGDYLLYGTKGLSWSRKFIKAHLSARAVPLQPGKRIQNLSLRKLVNMERQRYKSIQTILRKKNKTEQVTLPNFRTCYKVTVFKTVLYLQKDSKGLDM